MKIKLLVQWNLKPSGPRYGDEVMNFSEIFSNFFLKNLNFRIYFTHLRCFLNELFFFFDVLQPKASKQTSKQTSKQVEDDVGEKEKEVDGR